MIETCKEIFFFSFSGGTGEAPEKGWRKIFFHFVGITGEGDRPDGQIVKPYIQYMAGGFCQNDAKRFLNIRGLIERISETSVQGCPDSRNFRSFSIHIDEQRLLFRRPPPFLLIQKDTQIELNVTKRENQQLKHKLQIERLNHKHEIETLKLQETILKLQIQQLKESQTQTKLPQKNKD